VWFHWCWCRALACVVLVRSPAVLFLVDLGQVLGSGAVQCTSTPRVAADDVPAGIDSGSVSPSTSRFDDSDVSGGIGFLGQNICSLSFVFPRRLSTCCKLPVAFPRLFIYSTVQSASILLGCDCTVLAD
jgi:hypothetical protein